jgi:excinuclease ABC subunit C
MTVQAQADSLPTGPGVYLFKGDVGKDQRRRVLYIGKAQNLRSRVRTYLTGGDGRIRIPALVERIRDIEVIVTANVKDALLLENELIKQHKPPYNVRLRDDKQYLALRMDPKDTWPRLTQVRRFRRDGAQYFGPYTSSTSMKDALYNLRRIFPLRTCSDGVFRDYQRRGRPCIEFEMGRCLAPCCDRVDRETYDELVRGTTLFLKGRSAELVDHLRAKMLEAGEQERFEEAARLRDRISAVENTVERQRIVSERPVDRDVFGLARQGSEVEVQVLHVREGRVVGTQGYSFSDVRIHDGDVMTSFLGQFYGDEDSRQVPQEVLAPTPVDDDGGLESLLTEYAGRRVSVRTPQRGQLREMIALATSNAEHGLSQRMTARDSVAAALEELRETLGLESLPRRIEGYDVSTFRGSIAVASRVVFEDGLPCKADYRRYRIREAAPDDDLACLREVFERRLKRVEGEPLADLLMVDGGRGQLGVLVAALADAQLRVDAIGLSKERDEQSPSPRVRRSGGLKAERVFTPGRLDPVMLPPSSRGLLLLQRVRDESHRFAIEFQRDLRQKVGLTSILEELPGIGPTKRRALLRHFGSLRGVRSASESELAAAAGVSPRDAAVIVRFFAAEESLPVDSEPAAAAPESAPDPGEGGNSASQNPQSDSGESG